MRIMQYTRNITILLLLSFVSLTGFAQEDGAEKLKKMKIGFLTDKLDLTSDEAEKFWPIYNEYMDEKSAIIKKFKKADDDPDAGVKQKKAEANLAEKYNTKFKEVLSDEKVTKLHKAEKEFNKILIEQLKKRQNKEE